MQFATTSQVSDTLDSMHRRNFLAVTAASVSQTPGFADPIRAGIIGSGVRGRYLTANFKELGVEMMAVCDVYEPNLQAGLKAASTGARSYDNYKRLLDDSTLGAVIVATPDHWHAQMVIDAVEAGKDVYVEKPLAHTIDDGFRVIEAVRRTRRVVQVGTQRRSFELFQEGKRIVDSGKLGDVRLVNSWWLNHQVSLVDRKLEGKLDWRQWLGTAPARDLDPQRFFNWYYFLGLLRRPDDRTSRARDRRHSLVHEFDLPGGGNVHRGPHKLPGAEVPETTCMAIEYPENYLAVFTLGYKAMHYAPINDQLKQFHGSKARLDMGRESYALYPESRELVMQPSEEKRQPGSFESATRAHIRNFIECVKTRRDPNATVEMGQSTNIVLCMAMESLRRGRRITWNAAARKMEN